jgi:excisionase family DNA binding protein
MQIRTPESLPLEILDSSTLKYPSQVRTSALTANVPLPGGSAPPSGGDGGHRGRPPNDPLDDFPDDGLLTTADVAAILKITARTVRTLAQVGELPALRVGRQWRFLKHDLLTYLRNRKKLNRGS